MLCVVQVESKSDIAVARSVDDANDEADNQKVLVRGLRSFLFLLLYTIKENKNDFTDQSLYHIKSTELFQKLTTSS